MPSYLGSTSSGMCPGLRACGKRRDTWSSMVHAHHLPWRHRRPCPQGSHELWLSPASMACLGMRIFARMLLAPSASCASGPASPGSSSTQRAVLSLLSLGLGGKHSSPCFSKTVCLCPQILFSLTFSYSVISLKSPCLWKTKARRT